jgi:MFS family permease
MTTCVVSTRTRPVPAEYKTNFNHLVWDIAWFGVLNGSAISYLSVFATRQGASALEIGLLTALPAVINLGLALPAGSLLQKRSISDAVFHTSVLNRLFYLVWMFLPVLLAPRGQVVALIVLTALMSIPGTALAIGFNALFAAAVPPEWRAQVAGVRNAAYALTSIALTLLCGWLLDRLPFPFGYQVVFAIGVLGAVMSSVHLRFIRPPDEPIRANSKRSLRDWAQPGVSNTWLSLRTTVGLRFLARRANGIAPNSSSLKAQWLTGLQLLEGSYRRILLLVFALHLTLYLSVPLIPLQMVNGLGLSDEMIGLGNALFFMAVFAGSTQLDAVTRRLGHRRSLGLGMMVISFYPFLLAFSGAIPLYLLTSVVGGAGWSLTSGALGNYVLERVPDDKRPTYLAWYNMALQGGVLLGSLVAPTLAGWWGLTVALLIAAFFRFLTGQAIWHKG